MFVIAFSALPGGYELGGFHGIGGNVSILSKSLGNIFYLHSSRPKTDKTKGFVWKKKS